MIMNIGDRIRLAREAKKWSQVELGKACGNWSQQRIRNYESNTREPRKAYLETVARALDVQPEWLLTGAGESKAIQEATFMDIGANLAFEIMLYLETNIQNEDINTTPEEKISAAKKIYHHMLRKSIRDGKPIADIVNPEDVRDATDLLLR